ncbi:MAG: hypothetical protein H6686_12480 [Fibrobacteria bacterium]|nr:hypothetical protein [Fibrobacteria bacterium]
MVNIGNTLFAMDAYSPSNAPESRPNQWRIWRGEAGSNSWRQIPLPNGDIPNEWIVIGSKLIVGTKYTARIYSYDPSEGEWQQLITPVPPGDPDSLPFVEGLGRLGNMLAVGVGMNVTNRNYCFLKSPDDSGWVDIPCVGSEKRIPWDFSATIGDTLYGISAQFGVFRYREGDSLWDSLPMVIPESNPNFQNLSAAAAIDGKLYVGTRGWWEGLFRWDDDHWTSMTPTPGDGSNKRETTKSIYVIATYRDRLFFTGDEGGSIVMHVPQDSGKIQFGDWRLVDEKWCKILNGCPLQTRGIVGIGDTLYATGWSFVAKVPFADLDKMARPLYLK